MPVETFSVHALFKRILADLPAREHEIVDIDEAVNLWLVMTQEVLHLSCQITGGHSMAAADHSIDLILQHIAKWEQRND